MFLLRAEGLALSALSESLGLTDLLRQTVWVYTSFVALVEAKP